MKQKFLHHLIAPHGNNKSIEKIRLETSGINNI